jgi:hypothetical protein
MTGQSRFSIIPSAALDDPKISAMDLRVLALIGSYTGKDMTCYPRQSTLADRLGVARETINRAVMSLAKAGYLVVIQQRRGDGGQRENLYQVRLDPDVKSLEKAPPPVIHRSHPLCATDHTPCDPQITPRTRTIRTRTIRTNPLTPKGGTHSPESLFEDEDESALSPKTPHPPSSARPPAPHEGEAVGKEAPAKSRERSSRAKVKAQLAKIDVDPSRLIDAVRSWASSPDAKKDGGQFAPALDRWFRDGKYEHYLPAASGAGDKGDCEDTPDHLAGSARGQLLLGLFRTLAETGKWHGRHFGEEFHPTQDLIPVGMGYDRWFYQRFGLAEREGAQ